MSPPGTEDGAVPRRRFREINVGITRLGFDDLFNKKGSKVRRFLLQYRFTERVGDGGLPVPREFDGEKWRALGI